MKLRILRGFYVTLFTFFSLWGLSQITKFEVFNALDPIAQALQGFEITDYVFSNVRPTPEIDQRIVLVNIGPSRRHIAEQIRIISQYNPKVIGVDSFFNCEGGLYDTLNCPQLLDTLGNLILGNAIQEAGNVVLVSRLLQSDSLYNSGAIDIYDSIEYSDPIFNDHAYHGFANLPTGDEEGEGAATYQEDVKICRSVIPKMKVKGERHLAFSVQMAMLFDSAKTERFLARGNYEEVINFKGNIEIPDVKLRSLRENMQSTSEFRSLCFAIDWPDLFEEKFVPGMFENSVVILGYLGDYFGDTAWEDKFFTPLNSKVAGRANPDMFGPVIHANVVAMILNEDYVNQLAEWEKFVIAFLMCFLNVFLLTWIDRKFPVWYDGLSVIVQLVEIILVFFLIVGVFAAYSLKMDLTLTMGILALVGPCFDLMKSLENTLIEVLPLER